MKAACSLPTTRSSLTRPAGSSRRPLTWPATCPGHVAPDAVASDEARIIAELGAWIGAEVLGPVADAMADQRPVAVHVMLPAAARSLLSLPLELAHVGGEPLALRGITLVWDTNGDQIGRASCRERV